MADNSFEHKDEKNKDKLILKQIESSFGKFSNVIVSGPSKTVDAVEAGGRNMQPNAWPDMDNVDNLVNVLTVAGYAFTTFSVVGTTYFLARTAREAFQWRAWAKYTIAASKQSRDSIPKNQSDNS